MSSRNSLRLFLLLVFILSSTQLKAQDDRDREQQLNAFELIIEALSEQNDEGLTDDTYLQRLYDIYEDPIDLNRATEAQLRSLGLLSQPQIDQLLNYIDRDGDMMSIYELQAVPLLDAQTIENILPFVMVTGRREVVQPTMRHMLFNGKNELFLRMQRVLQTKDGYRDRMEGDSTIAAPYQGSPEKLYLRYRHKYKTRLSYGLTAEKDDGEDFFRGSNKNGFDFYSAHLFLRDVGPFESLAIGDYEVNIGQGLVAWSGFAFSKGPYVLDVKRVARPLKAYTSVNEANFFRGIGATTSWKRWHLTGFASRRKIDAGIGVLDTVTNSIDAISSFYESGYHRTLSDIAKKKTVEKTNFGGHLSYYSRKFSLGLTAMYTGLDRPILTDLDPYQTFRFQGDKLVNFGINYHYLWHNIHFFGEAAMDDNQAIATIQSAMINFDAPLQMGIVHRYYQKDYQSFSSGAFGENGSPSNESGTYISATFKPFHGLTLDTYYDLFRHSFLRFEIDGPSRGNDYFAQLTYRPSRRTETYVRFKNEVKEKNRRIGENEEAGASKELYNTDLKRLRWHFQHRVNSEITLKSRVAFSWFDSGTEEIEKGMMLYQDFNYAPKNWPLTFATRFGLFDVASSDTRIYTYENDILYAFSVPGFQGKGSRFYLMTKYELNRHFSCWLRFAQTYYSDRDVISSGNEEILGNKRSDIKVQVRFKW